MSDQLENFIRNNRDKLDTQSPSPELWGNISSGLAASGSGAAAAAAAGKSGLAAKWAAVGTTWKIVAGAIATLAIASAIYIGSGSGNNPPGNDQQSQAITGPDQDGTPIEVVSDEKPLVDPPIPAADVPFQNFQVDAQKGGTLELTTGTEIEIPANAFVYEDGKPVTGEVTISYREFHDAADIILSGITMEYDENGVSGDFQTAGMIDIRGSQAEAPVYIAEGQELVVNMASFTEEDDYNLYFLDEEEGAGGWTDIGRAKIKRNKKKEKGLKMVKAKPRKPKRPRSESEVAQNDLINLKVDYGEFPELRQFKKVKWEAVDKEYLAQNERAMAVRWSNIKLEETAGQPGVYTMIFSNSKSEFSLDVRPVLKGKDAEKAMANFEAKMANYEELVAQRETELDRLRSQADIHRSFRIAGFGIYNCDRIASFPDPLVANLVPEFPEDTYMERSKVIVYHILGDGRAVINWNANSMRRFTYSESEKNYLVVVLPNSELSFVGPEEMKKLDKRKIRRGNPQSIEFKHTGVTIHNAVDLRTALNL